MTNDNESDEKMPSSLSPTAIKSMTVAELKRQLKRRDLNCQGLKATLAQRLLDFYDTEKDDDDDDDDDAPTRRRTTPPPPQLDLKEEAKRKAEDAVARFEEENNNKNKNDVVVPPNDEGRRNKKRRRNNGDGGESRRTVQTLDDDDDDDDEDPGDDDDDEKTAAARGGRRQRGGGKTRGSRGGGGGSKGGSKEDATKEKGDDEGQPEYECMYSVPCPGNEGRIIGKRGQKIRELQAKYGVVMQMNREKVTVEIMGDRDKVRECEAEVVKIIEDGNVRNMEKEQRQQQHHQQRGGGGGGGGGGRREENRGTNHQKEEIPCSGMEGRIIGRGGETIHRLEAESGARVRINRDRLVCEISGEPGRVQTAVRMVHELMARGDSRTGGDGGGNQQGGQQSVYGQAYGQQQQQQQQQFGQPAATTQVYGAASTYGQPASSNAAPVYGQQPQTYGTRQVYGQEAPSSSAPVYGQQVYGAPQTQVQRVAPPPAPSSSLPPDWEEVNQGGQIYYWNTRTNLTQYERPV
jgi:far upstream element-binding protein